MLAEATPGLTGPRDWGTQTYSQNTSCVCLYKTGCELPMCGSEKWQRRLQTLCWSEKQIINTQVISENTPEGGMGRGRRQSPGLEEECSNMNETGSGHLWMEFQGWLCFFHPFRKGWPGKSLLRVFFCHHHHHFSWEHLSYTFVNLFRAVGVKKKWH